MTADTTTLYRLYDTSGALLYIGIAGNPGRRFEQHASDKPWWGQVATCQLAHYPNRTKALSAERQAITAEHPRFNITHNRGGTSRNQPPPMLTGSRDQWTYRSRRYHGGERTTPLHLFHEISCVPCVDDVHWADGEEQLEHWIDYMRRNYPDQWEADSVKIDWFLEPVGEAAPFSDRPGTREDFLSFYTWPTNATTGEPVDWFQLPVINNRFPEFEKALAYTPAPFQRSFPIRSFWEGRNHRYAPIKAAL